MCNIEDNLKTPERRMLERFYGREMEYTSNKYFIFKRFISKDAVIVLTNNIKYVHDNPVLVVAKNKGVYLKDWQLRQVHNIKAGVQNKWQDIQNINFEER